MMYIRYIFFTVLTLSNIVIAADNGSFLEIIHSNSPSNYLYSIVKNDADVTLKDHIISFDEFKKAQEENCNNWDNDILDESKRPKEEFNFVNIYFKQITNQNKSKYDFSDLLIDAFELNDAVQLKRQNGIISNVNYASFLAMNLSLEREKRNKYYNISESKNLLKKTFITFSPELISIYNKFVKYSLLFFSFIFDFDLPKMVKKYSFKESKIQENEFIDVKYANNSASKK